MTNVFTSSLEEPFFRLVNDIRAKPFGAHTRPACIAFDTNSNACVLVFDDRVDTLLIRKEAEVYPRRTTSPISNDRG